MYYLLLLIALILYFRGKKVYSILLFFIFNLYGLRILPDVLFGAKLSYMAFGYIVIISLFESVKTPGYFTNGVLAKPIWIFLSFMGISLLFSMFYYGFPFTGVVTITLRYTVILSYFFLIRLSGNEINKLLRIFLHITTVTSILYILQTVTGIQLLAYNMDTPESSSETGLYRFYNAPPLLDIFFLMSIFYPSIFNKKFILFYQTLFIAAIVATMGRTAMLGTAISVVIGYCLSGNIMKNYKKILLFSIILIPFFSFISTRFEGGGTNNDIQLIGKGKYFQANEIGGGQGATLSYRLAWVMERWEYLRRRPVSEIVFGLGLLSDEHPKIRQKYFFRYGLINKENGRTAQLRTPDISWGNLLTQLGILGSCLWLYIWITMIKFFYKRKTDKFSMAFLLLLAYYFLTSISSHVISEPYSTVIFFLAMAAYIYKSDQYEIYYRQYITNNNKL